MSSKPEVPRPPSRGLPRLNTKRLGEAVLSTAVTGVALAAAAPAAHAACAFHNYYSGWGRPNVNHTGHVHVLCSNFGEAASPTSPPGNACIDVKIGTHRTTYKCSYYPRYRQSFFSPPYYHITPYLWDCACGGHTNGGQAFIIGDDEW